MMNSLVSPCLKSYLFLFCILFCNFFWILRLTLKKNSTTILQVKTIILTSSILIVTMKDYGHRDKYFIQATRPIHQLSPRSNRH